MKFTPPQITQPLPEVDVADPTPEASADDDGEHSASDLQGAKAPRKGWLVYPTGPPPPPASAPFLPPMPYGYEGSLVPFAFAAPYPSGSASPLAGTPISSASSSHVPPPPSHTEGHALPYPYGPPAFFISYPYYNPRTEGPVAPYTFTAPYPYQGVTPIMPSSSSAVPQTATPLPSSASSGQPQSNTTHSFAPYPSNHPRVEPLTPFTLTPEPPIFPPPTTSVLALNDAVRGKPKATKKKRKEPPTPVESDSGTPAAALPRPKPRRTTKKQNQAEEHAAMDVDEPPPPPRPKPRRVTKKQSLTSSAPAQDDTVAEPTEAPAVMTEKAPGETSSSNGLETDTGTTTISGAPTKAPRRRKTVSCAPRRTSSRAASKKAAAALAEIVEKDEVAMNEAPGPSPREENNDHDMDVDK